MSESVSRPESISKTTQNMRFVYDTIHDLHERALKDVPDGLISPLGSHALQFAFKTPDSPPVLRDAARALKNKVVDPNHTHNRFDLDLFR